MKIKNKTLSYEQAMALPEDGRFAPKRPTLFFRTLLRILSASELKSCNFTYELVGMEKLGKNEPALFLMNHSSFIDLKIASRLLYPRPFNIVCTSDGFVGKAGLMRSLGCIPTKKFIPDLQLVRDMSYAAKTLQDSILMYPEASYSFDGTATPLPESLGKCLKLLGLPVVMISTEGAFAHDPLYNMLQLRKVKVSARMEYLLSPEDIRTKSFSELNAILAAQFRFDHFRWQQENHVRISEPFRADGLNRVLYKCPKCRAEGHMLGKGTVLRCRDCGKEWTLDEYGFLRSDGEVFFEQVSDWYAWERECVREELLSGSYSLDISVDIKLLRGTDCLYSVGSGRLRHDADGFVLDGCEGKLHFEHPPLHSYSLYSDFFWYELGDMICIGTPKVLYYCFPQDSSDIVAKTRLAAEELYRLQKKTAPRN